MKNINWTQHFIELLIVIIGISIAFWINNLASVNRDKNLEAAFIQELKSDLQLDKDYLTRNIRVNERKLDLLGKGLELLIADTQRQYPDSLFGYLHEIGNYDFFDSRSFTLVSLLQSGDIKLITSNELKRELLKLLSLYEAIDFGQENLLQALDSNYFPTLVEKVDMIEGRLLDPNYFYSTQVKNVTAFTMNDTQQLVDRYNETIKQIERVISLMD